MVNDIYTSESANLQIAIQTNDKSTISQYAKRVKNGGSS